MTIVVDITNDNKDIMHLFQGITDLLMSKCIWCLLVNEKLSAPSPFTSPKDYHFKPASLRRLDLTHLHIIIV